MPTGCKWKPIAEITAVSTLHYLGELRREESDFLTHKNHAGLFADFHSLRHYFITSLERSGISPKMAQTLARHSDIRLTLGVYAHVGLNHQTEAIAGLPGPPRAACKADARQQDD